jgi:hypothetical protein
MAQRIKEISKSAIETSKHSADPTFLSFSKLLQLILLLNNKLGGFGFAPHILGYQLIRFIDAVVTELLNFKRNIDEVLFDIFCFLHIIVFGAELLL